MSQYAGMTQTETGAGVLCDLRSDTVTRPDDAMRQAMAAAEVGDDVYGEDPQVNQLEATLAERLGKEAGLFLPTGTQSNLTALLSHCGRGEEIITGRDYHVFKYEAAGASVLGGSALYPLEVQPGGGLDPAAIAAAVKPDDSHMPISRLLSLENTHNGQAISLEDMRAMTDAGRAAGLSLHLDGARFFNAITELGCSAPHLAVLFDTVSICLSKGLGTPAGSVLVGPSDLIARARRWRKMLGGGMRQSGVLAAAGLMALEQNVDRLSEDHARAATLADALRALGAGEVTQATNMVFFTPAEVQNAALQAHLAKAGVVIGAGDSGPIRLVLHKDVTDEGLNGAIAAFQAFFS
ncbi:MULTISPECIES: low-specificity L-threonine aldolase [Rhodobacterales]|uniref:low-specificity L-threonine aldolase n=1 Tax=Rhodobacterales TaxID=204455 RepID=UPI00237F4E88|nr:low-specificity L-threonine aldolase [Phaeobacter gallaeciensis]MDE4140097.1 low-specificity L-threonine aldolase [Phaeobacter gallaeciensis]MDE4148293.1 low-specificity L-threonine aldolase [Phaeobacter gallaeciensis]MDE4152764.1 low-specificity L-threonine aldolase [Phaeobacter gallaeciensis]MDE4227903.1 low-specificity L-threonine aldolase [Phaeobacter gallaeciensis]MDE4257229.1 low-specificity L-threonine aldolase [Phaeobacter gallaeciensis]